MTDATALSPQTPGQYLEAAYAQHAAPCRLYAQQIIGASGADDAVQEAFIRLMRHLVRENSAPRAPRAWLLAATRSAALDLLRSQRRRRRREDAAGRPEPFVPEPGAAMDARAIAEALKDLPPRQRETIVLRIWGELGFAAIAEMLGVAISTAHGDYAAGLASLRELLEPRAAEAKGRRATTGSMP